VGRTPADGSLDRFPGPFESKEKPEMLVDLLALVPACLAGIGGALLGDKLGLWIKEKVRTSGDG
jgi:hypothetical protein